MRLIYTADIHASPNHLASLIEISLSNKAEGIIVGGDIIPHHLPQFSGMDIIGAQAAYLRSVFIPTFQKLKQRTTLPVYLDMGNDDLTANRPLLEAYDGNLFSLLHMRRTQLFQGVDVLGYMMVPPTPFHRKDWEKPDTSTFPHRPGNLVQIHGYTTENGRMEKVVLDLQSTDTIETDLALLSKQIRGPFVLVAHSPPSDTSLDITGFGTNVGSLAVRNFIAHWAQKGLLIAALHGHIHEAPSISGTTQARINGVLCINPGQNQGPQSHLRYMILDLEAGQRPPAITVIKDAA